MSLLEILLLASILLVEPSSGTNLSANPFAMHKRPTDRIVGGDETTIQANRWQVALLYQNSLRCGGSIIGRTWILTAAHCTYGTGPRYFAVRVGCSYHQSGGTVIRVRRIVQHRSYSPSTTDYDFSLLLLAKPLTIGEGVHPISLPSASTTVADGTKCMVTGWGYTKETHGTSAALRGAIVPIVNQTKCNKQYGGAITPRMICAGYDEGGIDACVGDSGGPLTTKDKGFPELIGVVSFGNGCARPKFAGVYARVSSVRAWIKRETRI